MKSFASMLFLAAFSANSDSYTISFDESGLRAPTDGNNCATCQWKYSKNKGQIIDEEFTSSGHIGALGGVDVTFWAQTDWSHWGSSNVSSDPNAFNNANSDLFLTLFNTDATWATQDEDLKVDQGNVAIIHERNEQCNLAWNGGKGLCKDPDDRYSGNNPHGGFIFVEFSEAVSLKSIDLADMEDGANQRGSFSFYGSAGNMIDSVEMMTVTGNRGYAKHDFSLSDTISYLVIRMQGSGGFKNLSFNTASATQVPEPSTMVLFALALLLIYRQKASA
ncbi:PEP-CTERM sorting domain-containing protein [Thalassotalea sp. LPB0316]|uniref:PEP-CTERM sorting domain-containing protein n=1 Tax=Thalassotalea sp. LPB0316 TaxID=2769490 RepID=UPI001866F155|nr:PEP-CTERM sorting domain-containing protein [Thalassotalea sp. LPB0316]QOL25304.1 PEP-CTERM sorting domain-containing protein [Thalassotalea sp. LPB0316]